MDTTTQTAPTSPLLCESHPELRTLVNVATYLADNLHEDLPNRIGVNEPDMLAGVMEMIRREMGMEG